MTKITIVASIFLILTFGSMIPIESPVSKKVKSNYSVTFALKNLDSIEQDKKSRIESILKQIQSNDTSLSAINSSLSRIATEVTSKDTLCSENSSWVKAELLKLK